MALSQIRLVARQWLSASHPRGAEALGPVGWALDPGGLSARQAAGPQVASVVILSSLLARLGGS
jgi:hypothetical protein